jgi:hypothetical protein
MVCECEGARMSWYNSSMKIRIFLFVVLIVGTIGVNEVQAATTTATTTYQTPAEVETKVREYFKEMPAMIEIARCESKFRHYTDGGSVLRGGAGGGMVGVFQFYEAVHAAGAASLGHNLTTLEGNLAYAKHVYDTQGTTPWNSSRSCWNVPVATVVDTEPDRAVLLKKIELLTQLILLLKQLAALR